MNMPVDTREALRKDPETGHYRVQPGYGHVANQYKINETWLDEDDNLWIDGEAVERLESRDQAAERGQEK